MYLHTHIYHANTHKHACMLHASCNRTYIMHTHKLGLKHGSHTCHGYDRHPTKLPQAESPPSRAIDKFGTITVRFQTKWSWPPNLRPIIILKVSLSEKSRIIVQFGGSGSKLYLKLQIKLNILTHCHVWQPGCVSKISTGNFWLHGTEKLISSTFWTWLGPVWTKMSLFCEQKVTLETFSHSISIFWREGNPKNGFPSQEDFRLKRWKFFWGFTSRFCERWNWEVKPLFRIH